MPRAHRYFLPGYVWHITHRCHKKEFLLKFKRDRQRWRYWLFEARKRYGLCVLNYIVTSNHIHLLVRDRGDGEIAKSLQLIAGRTAQEFNLRKKRKGAYWEDRYRATAVDTEVYLARCMTYIDMNMVRAGAVSHPEQWRVCGYREIQDPPVRYAVIDQTALVELMGFNNFVNLQEACRDRVEQCTRSGCERRDTVWSESLAVGRPEFIDEIQTRLGVRAIHRKSMENGGVTTLREASLVYMDHFDDEINSLSGDNTILLT